MENWIFLSLYVGLILGLIIPNVHQVDTVTLTSNEHFQPEDSFEVNF